MAKTLPKIASFLRPLGKGTDELVAVKLHSRAVTVAEVRHNSNVINIDNLASAGLPRNLDIQNLARQQDMVVDVLRTMREQSMFSAQDAGIVIPSGVVTLRQINLPFMSPTELAKEAKDVSFWAEAEPDLAKLEDPFVAYYTLVSSENDDLTRVVIGYAELATLRPWSDALLGAHLNPAFIELEPVSLANYLYASLPADERRQSQAILHISDDRMEIIAFQPTRFHTVKLEISEFDQVLLSEIEDVERPTGDFWDEVGGRVANTLKQAVLFLQEEQDFPPFSVGYVAVDALRAQNLMWLLDKHFTLAPITLWEPTNAANMSQPVESLLSQVSNRSGFASAFGLAMRKLGTFGDDSPGIIKLSMLPQSVTLRRNRQMGVITRTMIKFWVLAVFVMAGWTLGVVVPGFLESQRESRGFDAIRVEAQASQERINNISQAIQALDNELANISVAAARSGKYTIMDTLPDLVPEGVELSAYELGGGNAVTLRGTAISQDVIVLFVTELLNSGLIQGPNAGQPVPREGTSYFDFVITGTLAQES